MNNLSDETAREIDYKAAQLYCSQMCVTRFSYADTWDFMSDYDKRYWLEKAKAEMEGGE